MDGVTDNLNIGGKKEVKVHFYSLISVVDCVGAMDTATSKLPPQSSTNDEHHDNEHGSKAKATAKSSDADERPLNALNCYTLFCLLERRLFFDPRE